MRFKTIQYYFIIIISIIICIIVVINIIIIIDCIIFIMIIINIIIIFITIHLLLQKQNCYFLFVFRVHDDYEINRAYNRKQELYIHATVCIIHFTRVPSKIIFLSEYLLRVN